MNEFEEKNKNEQTIEPEKGLNKKKKIIIIGIIILGVLILLSLFYIFFFDKIFKKDTKQNNNQDNNIIENNTEKEEFEGPKIIYVYKNKNDEINLYVIDNTEEYFNKEEYDNDENYQFLSEYQCNNVDCDYYFTDQNSENIIVVKDENYYLFNYKEGTTEKINLNKKDYYDIQLIFEKDKLYGYILLNKDNDNSYSSYYSVKQNKYLFEGYVNYSSYYNPYNDSFILRDTETNKYYLYNFINEKFTDLNFENNNYKYIMPVVYDNILYGYELTSEDNSYFYSLKDSKITLTKGKEAEYSSGAELTQNNMFYGKILYNYSTGEIVHDFSSQLLKSTEENEEYCDAITINGVGNKDHIYYYVNADCIEIYNYYLFNEDYEIMLEGKKFSDFDVTDEGYLIVRNTDKDDDATTFSKYNKNGELIFTSKAYKSVELITEGYIAVIDTDNYLKLIDYNESVVAKFVKWTKDLYLHTMISGYYEYKDIPGIYLVVQDNSLGGNESEEGYGYEYYYDINTKKTGKIATEIGGYAKPILYLYPTKKTNVTVSFKYPNLLTTTYPKFNNSWNVTAYPNGDLYDAKGNYYYALYWEELKNHEVDFKEGFYVTKDNAISFLEEKLTIIGLNPKEKNEFIMYWLPVLEKNKQSLVYFELTSERDSYNRLIMNPTPDSLLRVAIHIKKVDKKINIKEEKLTSFKRTGFAAIEWGGVVH